MKLTTNKKYVLYHNFTAGIYGYDIVSRIDDDLYFWNKRTPIMYSDSLKVIELATRNLNK